MGEYKTAVASSLLQVASSSESSLKKFSQQLQELKPKLAKHNTQYSAMIYELIALTANPKSETADKIIGLLEELLKVLKDTQTSVSAHKAELERRWAEDKPAHEAKIDAAKKEISRLDKLILSTTATIGQLTKDIAKYAGQIADYEAEAKRLADELQSIHDEYKPKIQD